MPVIVEQERLGAVFKVRQTVLGEVNNLPEGGYSLALRTTWFRYLPRYPEAMRRERAQGLGWLEFQLPFPYSRGFLWPAVQNVGYFAIGWDARELRIQKPPALSAHPTRSASALTGGTVSLPRLKKFTLYFCPAKRPLSTAYAPNGDAYRDESHQADEEDL